VVYYLIDLDYILGENNIMVSQKRNPLDIAEIERLRFIDRLSLQEIGNRFGISRQRVLQILGSTGKMAMDLEDKINSIPDLYTLSVAEVTEIIGCDPGYTHQALNNYSNYSTYNINVLRKLKEMGISFTRLSKGVILINGKHKVKISQAGTTCKTSPKIDSPQYHFNNRTKENLDFFIFYISTTEDFFIIPFNLIADRMDIYFCWPTKRLSLGKFQQFHNRFDLLE